MKGIDFERKIKKIIGGFSKKIRFETEHFKPVFIHKTRCI